MLKNYLNQVKNHVHEIWHTWYVWKQKDFHPWGWAVLSLVIALQRWGLLQTTENHILVLQTCSGYHSSVDSFGQVVISFHCGIWAANSACPSRRHSSNIELIPNYTPQLRFYVSSFRPRQGFSFFHFCTNFQKKNKCFPTTWDRTVVSIMFIQNMDF